MIRTILAYYLLLIKDTDLEVMIVFQPIPKKQGWQPGFFEKVIGGWEGGTLVRK